MEAIQIPVSSVYGRLTVTGRAPNIGTRAAWICRCDCGNVVVVSGSALRRRNNRSCGCLVRDRKRKHGEATDTNGPTREYLAWQNMKARCYYPKSPGFKHWGGRGIIVCERWREDFKNFLSDMSRCPPNFTLDRINSNGNYEPGNCRWATRKEQIRNQRPRTSEERSDALKRAWVTRRTGKYSLKEL